MLPGVLSMFRLVTGPQVFYIPNQTFGGRVWSSGDGLFPDAGERVITPAFLTSAIICTGLRHGGTGNAPLAGR